MVFKRSDFQPVYKHAINTGISGITLKVLFEENDLDMDVYLPSYGCNLQRGYVWTLEQKQAFIEAAFRGISFPPVVIVREHSSVNWWQNKSIFKVLDGKQRLTALKEFSEGKFTFPFNGFDVSFFDLEKVAQGDILFVNLLTFDVHHSYPDNRITDDVLVQIFENCNFKGTPQDVEHINNIKNRKK